MDMSAFSKLIKPKPFYVLESDIGISLPWNPQGKGERPPSIPAIGIWDTGATHTVFDRSLIEKLGLKAVDRTSVNTSKGRQDAGIYVANVYLSGNIIVDLIRIIDGVVLGGDDETGKVLIGMDIISKGDFFLSTNPQGQMKFSFRIPSQGHDFPNLPPVSPDSVVQFPGPRN